MFGYAEAELIGENVSTLMPSPDRERHDDYMRNYRRTGHSQDDRHWPDHDGAPPRRQHLSDRTHGRGEHPAD